MEDDKNKDNLAGVVTPLAEDLACAMRALKADDSQFNRRSLVRCHFSYVEALSFVLRQVLIMKILDEEGQDNKAYLDRADIHRLTLLLEETPSPARNGTLDLQQQKVPLLNHFAFTLKQCKEEFGIVEDFL